MSSPDDTAREQSGHYPSENLKKWYQTNSRSDISAVIPVFDDVTEFTFLRCVDDLQLIIVVASECKSAVVRSHAAVSMAIARSPPSPTLFLDFIIKVLVVNTMCAAGVHPSI